MARKTLLTESEVRQFMKLANIKPLQEMGGPLPVPGMRDEEDEDEPGMRDAPGMRDEPGMRDDEDEPGMRDMREQEDEEMEMDADAGGEEMDMEMDAEGGDEEMDMDMGDEGGDMDMDMDMGAEGGEGKEEQFADVVNQLADLLGLDADVQVGEDEEDMGDEAMDDEGGDLEGAMDAPEGEDEMDMDDEEPGMRDAMMENDDDIVAEVVRRVAARLVNEKKQEDMANKLAERIFRRLASK